MLLYILEIYIIYLCIVQIIREKKTVSPFKMVDNSDNEESWHNAIINHYMIINIEYHQ